MALAQAVVRLEQVNEALALLEPADEEDVERSIAKLLDRRCGGEALNVDAVGDDPIVPREISADEMPSRAGDRDSALEFGRQLRGPPLPNPVAGAEATEGVEGGDVHRVGLVENGRRQEWDERLVEVEDVEPMLREQLASLLLEAPAERHAAHAAVGGEGPARSEPDDMPLALTFLPVLAGDDPRVMTESAQLLVLAAHVVVDATRVRESVRADEGDLERRPCA